MKEPISDEYKGEEPDSVLVNMALVRVMNEYRKAKSPKLSKMIKALKDNPTTKSLAYIQAKELLEKN